MTLAQVQGQMVRETIRRSRYVQEGFRPKRGKEGAEAQLQSAVKKWRGKNENE